MESKITIKERAKLIKPGSSSYNYYINTPLSELTSRDDKLVKKELELLLEEDTSAVEDEEESTLADKVATGAAIGAGATAAGAGAFLGATYIPQIINAAKKWINDVKTSFHNKKYAEEQSILAKERAENQSNSVQNGINANTPSIGNEGHDIADYYAFTRSNPNADLDAIPDFRNTITQLDSFYSIPEIQNNTKSSIENSIGNADPRTWDVRSFKKFYEIENQNVREINPSVADFLDKFYQKCEERGVFNATTEEERNKLYNEVINGINGVIVPPSPAWWSFTGMSTNIGNWIDKKLVEWGYKENDDDPNNPSQGSLIAGQTVVGLIYVAIVVIAVYAIWKIYRWFVKDDGTEKTKDEAVSESKYISRQVEEDILTGKYAPVTELGNPFSSKFNPMYNNVGLAIIHESDNEAEKVVASSDGSKGFMIKCAIKFSDQLLNDPKYVNHMNKNYPILVVGFEKFKEEAESSPESVQESKIITISEIDENTNDSRGYFGRTWDTIVNEFKRAGVYVSNKFNSIKEKIKSIYVNLDDGSIRWIPTLVTTAIAILGAASLYLLSKNGGNATNEVDVQRYNFNTQAQDASNFLKNKNENRINQQNVDDFANGKRSISFSPETEDNIYRWEKEQSEKNEESVRRGYEKINTPLTNINASNEYEYLLNKAVNGLSVFAETVELAKKENYSGYPLDNLNGKGEELANNIIERAKYISVDLLNDKEFIAFSKKNNLTSPSIMEKYISDVEKGKNK